MASKDASIAAQSAAKAAADLFQGTGDTDGAMKAMQRFYDGIIYLGGDPAQVGQPTTIAQAEQNLAQGGIQATVQRDLSSEQGRWEDAIKNNPQDWYNNVGDSRATSGGGSGPDFKFKDSDANVKPLFLNGKYGPAPAWVWEALGLQMPGGQQVQPVQQAPAQAPAQQGGNNPVPF